jgi:transposase|tara:strand:+ start:70 stop:366 length:297 start_codon:yes stop_codon:yes gene_type:complete
MKRRTFSTEFKLESASLVVDQGYSVKEAANSVGVGNSLMSKWVAQLRKERSGTTPVGRKALTEDKRKIQELEAKIKRLERENEIIKKATALLMSDPLR